MTTTKRAIEKRAKSRELGHCLENKQKAHPSCTIEGLENRVTSIHVVL